MYPASTTHTAHFVKFYIVKLKLLRKSRAFLLLGVTSITFVLRFKKSNKFYYVQTVKVVNSNNVGG